MLIEKQKKKKKQYGKGKKRKEKVFLNGQLKPTVNKMVWLFYPISQRLSCR